jgi:hypothetical protein
MYVVTSTLFFSEEWWGEQRVSSPGDKITLGGNFTLGGSKFAH